MFFRRKNPFFRFFAIRLNRNSFIPVLLVIAIIISVCYGVVLLIDRKISPIMQTYALSRAQQIGAQAIYNGISEVLEEENVTYDQLITLEKDANGEVTAIKTNIMAINHLKSVLAIKILEKINAVDSSQISIPLGNIINGELFSGRGPRIPVKLVPVGSVFTNITNEFTSAGINQTRHQLQVEVNAYVAIILPNNSTATNVKASFNISETVIVGDVPDTYTYVTGDDTSNLEKINNYVDKD